jgi:hypothetical protein
MWIDAVLAVLQSMLENMTVEQFVQNMRVLAAHEDRVTIPAYKGDGNCVVWELRHSTFKVMKAKDVVCTFYGGPPRKHSRYTGTLVTMFIDRLLTQAVHGDTNAIDQFLNGVDHDL